MKPDIKAIKAAAEKATPGDWVASDNGHIYSAALNLLVVAQHCRDKDANAKHIATANPATVIALCDEVERLTAALSEPAPVQEPAVWIKTSDQYPPGGVRVFWSNPQYNQVGYDTWIGKDYKFNAEYWMHIPEIGLATKPQNPAVGPVHPRHPVVVQWRNDGIEACAGIAEAYGNADAARDMRAMLTAAPQAQQPAPPAEVPMLTDEELSAIYKQANGEDVGKAQPLTTQRRR